MYGKLTMKITRLAQSITPSHPATVFKGDPLDPVRGKQYRDKILQPGGSREETDSLKVPLVLNLTILCGIHRVYRTSLDVRQTARPSCMSSSELYQLSLTFDM